MNDYDDLIHRDHAAYTAHEQMYRVRHPFPEEIPYEEVEPKPLSLGTSRQNLWAKLALLLMTLASIVVSGSRTVPEFGGDAIGVAAFCMVEIGIMTYAYLHTRMSMARHHVGRYIKLGITLALVLAVAANFNHEAGSTLASIFGDTPSQLIHAGILILIGIGAPLLAYINGDVLAMLTAQDEARQHEDRLNHLEVLSAWARRKADYNSAYRQAVELWRDGLNENYSRQRNKFNVTREVPRALPPEVPEPQEGQTDVTAFVRQLLSDPNNASLLEMSSRKAAQYIFETYGVQASKSTVNKVMIELRGSE